MKARRWHKNRRLEPSDEPPSQLDLKYLSYVRMENVEADLPPLWQAAGLRLLAGEQLLTAADFSLVRQAAFGGKRGVLYLTSLRLVWIGRPFNWIWDIFLGKLTVIDLPLGLIDSCSVSHRWLVKCIVVKRESRGRELRLFALHRFLFPLPHAAVDLGEWATAIDGLSYAARCD